MWLIDTETLQLKQVSDETVHPFAILSHTWEGEEVTFQDMQNLDAIAHKSGFSKISKTCRIARRSYKYVWIDTCCIDKTSSAELSEAINSMFRYYQSAGVCYVFLSDFESLPVVWVREKERLAMVAERLRHCKWFSRGWTLQELIAPRTLEFFDSEWNFLGEKADLEAPLCEITSIDESVLGDSSRLHTIPVARRMSWASRRQTTRVEDIAYCLLGIFNITMPLLYGEGSKAFLRLQQQIAMENSDLSIFAWESSHRHDQFSGIFAESPEDFARCSSLKMPRAKFTSMHEMTITNIGLRLSVAHTATHGNDILLNLNCMRNTSEGATEWLAVYLKKFGITYVRTRPFEIATTSSKTFWRTVSADAAQPIYVQPWLVPDEVRRISALLENIVIVRYDESMAKLVTRRTGMPPSAYTETGTGVKPLESTGSQRLREIWEEEQRQNPFGGAIFRTNAAEEFLGIHLITMKTGPSEDNIQQIVVIISLQWDGTRVRIAYALHEITSALMQYASIDYGVSEDEYLDRLQDYLLANCADLSGLLKQEKMPVMVNLYGGTFKTPRWVATVTIGKERGFLSRIDGMFYLVLKANTVSNEIRQYKEGPKDPPAPTHEKLESSGESEDDTPDNPVIQDDSREKEPEVPKIVLDGEEVTGPTIIVTGEQGGEEEVTGPAILVTGEQGDEEEVTRSAMIVTGDQTGEAGVTGPAITVTDEQGGEEGLTGPAIIVTGEQGGGEEVTRPATIVTGDHTDEAGVTGPEIIITGDQTDEEGVTGPRIILSSGPTIIVTGD